MLSNQLHELVYWTRSQYPDLKNDCNEFLWEKEMVFSFPFCDYYHTPLRIWKLCTFTIWKVPSFFRKTILNIFLFCLFAANYIYHFFHFLYFQVGLSVISPPRLRVGTLSCLASQGHGEALPCCLEPVVQTGSPPSEQRERTSKLENTTRLLCVVLSMLRECQNH